MLLDMHSKSVESCTQAIKVRNAKLMNHLKFTLVLAGAINCATVALVDAGIEMYDLVVASSLVSTSAGCDN